MDLPRAAAGAPGGNGYAEGATGGLLLRSFFALATLLRGERSGEGVESGVVRVVDVDDWDVLAVLDVVYVLSVLPALRAPELERSDGALLEPSLRLRTGRCEMLAMSASVGGLAGGC